MKKSNNKSVELLESCSFSFPKESNLVNEDSILPPIQINDTIYLALADGVGGKTGGKVASNLAISTIRKYIYKTPGVCIKKLFEIVKNEIDKYASENKSYYEMSTTLVVCKIKLGLVEIANVGDSRAYFISNSNLEQITKDHTEKQRLIDRGTFSKHELKGHFSDNILTNSMSAKSSFKLDYFCKELNKSSIILMSDGAYSALKSNRVTVNKDSIDLVNVCSNIKKRIVKSNPKDDYSFVSVSYRTI